MNWQQLWNAGRRLVECSLQYLDRRVKALIKPVPDRQVPGVLMDLFRSRKERIAEHAFLRQQLIILKRQRPSRPPITPQDRWLLVILSSLVRGWQAALHLVKPDTLIKWHRAGFRLFWRYKSQGRAGRPGLASETIALIKEMARANRLWGAPRIRDELRKLGINISKRTVQKYLRQARRDLPPERRSQTWATFLANHAQEIWACDFLQTCDVLFRPIFAFFMVELGSRRVVHCAVTRRPDDAWVAQQVREATPFGTGPRFLICDNDRKYGVQFERAAAGGGIEVIHTPVAAPRANAICERFVGSVRRECLDHLLILSARQLRLNLNEYVHYFNHARPHQGIEGRIPIPAHPPSPSVPPFPRLRRIPVLGGLHHDYQWAA